MRSVNRYVYVCVCVQCEYSMYVNVCDCVQCEYVCERVRWNVTREASGAHFDLPA